MIMNCVCAEMQILILFVSGEEDWRKQIIFMNWRIVMG